MNINKILSSLSKNLNMIGRKNAALMINNASYLYKYAISTDALIELSEWLEGDYSKLSFNKLFEGKLRVILPFKTEEEKLLIELVSKLKSMGWLPAGDGNVSFNKELVKQKLRNQHGEEYDTNVWSADLKISKKEEYIIPSGPMIGKQGIRTLTSSISKVISNPKNNIGENLVQFWNKNQTLYTRDYNWEQIEACFNLSDNDLKTKHYVIISRNPIDVLRMSDHENIQSCHSEGGSYFKCAISESRGNGLVAYIVKSSDVNDYLSENDVKSLSSLDKKEIFTDRERAIDGLSPISRVRLRKYVNEERGYEFAAPELRTYGENLPGFVNFVKDWAWLKQGDIFKKDDGSVELPNPRELVMYGGSHRDNHDSDIVDSFFSKGTDEKLEFHGDFRNKTNYEHDESSGDEEAELEDERDQLQDIINAYNSNNLNLRYIGSVDLDLNTLYFYASIKAQFHINLNGTTLDPSLDKSKLIREIKDIPNPTDFDQEVIDFSNILDVFGDLRDSENINNFDFEIFYKIYDVTTLEIETSMVIDYVQSTEDIQESFRSITSFIKRNKKIFEEQIRKKLIENGYMIESKFDELAEGIDNKNYENFYDYKLKNFNIDYYNIDSGEIDLVLKDELKAIDVKIPDSIIYAQNLKSAFSNSNWSRGNFIASILDGAVDRMDNRLIILNNISGYILEMINKMEEEARKQTKFDFFKEKHLEFSQDIKESVYVCVEFYEEKTDDYDPSGSNIIKYNLTKLILKIKIKSMYSQKQLALLNDLVLEIDSDFDRILDIILSDINEHIFKKESESKNFINTIINREYINTTLENMKASYSKDLILLSKWIDVNWDSFSVNEKIFATKFAIDCLNRGYNHNKHYDNNPVGWFDNYKKYKVSISDIDV
jgi:hypothetical protein